MENPMRLLVCWMRRFVRKLPFGRHATCEYIQVGMPIKITDGVIVHGRKCTIGGCMRVKGDDRLFGPKDIAGLRKRAEEIHRQKLGVFAVNRDVAN